MGKKKFGAWKDFYSKRVTQMVTQKAKVRRTLQSQGELAARELAKKFGISGYVESVIAKKGAK